MGIFELRGLIGESEVLVWKTIVYTRAKLSTLKIQKSNEKMLSLARVGLSSQE